MTGMHFEVRKASAELIWYTLYSDNLQGCEFGNIGNFFNNLAGSIARTSKLQIKRAKHQTVEVFYLQLSRKFNP